MREWENERVGEWESGRLMSGEWENESVEEWESEELESGRIREWDVFRD